ncbi:hypothetical protein [Helicobacter sp. WB40]|nr:hypothetical protein [Helicobacter sp. WB40]MDA3967362.1 hypothetical protein [Helicobacter sp. WB40]
MGNEAIKRGVLQALSKRDFKYFLYQKWEEYDKKPFFHNWHFEFLSEVLSLTIPSIAKSKELKVETRIMLNMPPSYGKTETLARSFIPYALGVDRSRKFMYISYSDELCKRISNEIRALIKSPFWANIFGKPNFLQDNSQEFIFKEGGGCFFTTLKSAITGFHAHCILIDDPIKVSEMNSKAARDMVNNNFQGSVLSRLKDNESSIVILMQRLGDEDLCGYLLNERNVSKSIIESWRILKLQAINEKEEIYKIGSFSYKREAREPLFKDRHTLEELEILKQEMGEDDFQTQMQQEPQARESGYFDISNFTPIASYELDGCNDYIFIDNAESLSLKADDRAIVVVGVDSFDSLPRYTLKDCIAGIFDEEAMCNNIIEMALKYRDSKIFIEGAGGGLMLYRLLQKEVLKVNERLKRDSKSPITNQIETYPTIKEISKMQKISSMKPYLNTGYLRYLSTALGVDKVKKQLASFNPEKPHRKNDCIDALSTALYFKECKPKITSKIENGQRIPQRMLKAQGRIWRI